MEIWNVYFFLFIVCACRLPKLVKQIGTDLIKISVIPNTELLKISYLMK